MALLGAWMLLSPVVLDHAQTGHGAWSDVLSGAALVAMALVRVTFPVRTALLGLVNAAVGVWLVISPFAFQYPQSAGAVIANDLLVGIAVIVLAVVGTITSSFAWRPRLLA